MADTVCSGGRIAWPRNERGQTVTNELRTQAEREIVRATIEAVLATGRTLKSISTGDGYERVGSVDEAMDLIFNLDESAAIFWDGERRSCVLFVLGNDGYDVVADYGMSLDAAIETVQPLIDSWESRLFA